jgi:hypothetical protein
MTNGQTLRAIANAQGIPLRTLDNVRNALRVAKDLHVDSAMARLMLRHGRLSDEARNFVTREYPQ